MNLATSIRLTVDLVKAGGALRKVRPGAEQTVADFFEAIVDEHRTRPALLTSDGTFTYRQLDELANRVANHFHELGVQPRDVVALDMENRPEFAAIWIGLAKLGVTTALINTNLAGAALAHSIEVADPAHLIVGAELADNLASVRGQLDDVRIWSQNGPLPDADDLDAALTEASADRPARSIRAGLRLGDTDLFYIYTSGTTGMPKAAHFSHFRFLTAAIGPAAAMGITPDDRQYVCLPMYHSAGGVVSIGTALMRGASAFIVPKFSASRFWSDIVEHDVTAFQYIGEMMRYLVNSEPAPEERQHNVRVCMGNGLRPEIWDDVVSRFRIPRIIEFYAATEGNVGFMNLDNTPGAIGWSPGWVRKLSGIHIVRFDVEADDVARGPDGFCIEVGVGEAGEAIGKIPTDSKATIGRFEGYSNDEMTDKKILRNVFEQGDSYFRTGDLLRYDKQSYFYFVDRIGDTFRWKGENVATTEVAQVLSTLDDVAEASVYGVTIPDTDGRAGMAAIVPLDGALDLDALYEATERDLASYARPVFVRVLEQMDVTGTFKHRKTELVAEGYDIGKFDDEIYFRDGAAGRYVRLDAKLIRRIESGTTRV